MHEQLYSANLDESQHFLGVHTCRVVDVGIHLPHVVEVTVGHHLLHAQLLVGVQQLVQVEPRSQQLHALVRERLARHNGDRENP